MKRFLQRLFLVFLATLLTLAGVEALVRVFWSKLNRQAVIPLTLKTHRFTANKVMGYELVPGSVSFEDGAWYRINGDGVRDRDFPLAKPAGVFRIAAVGDSCTFGLGLELEDTWPKQLERELRRTRPQVEVINFGVMGYNTPQEAERIQDKVLKYDPDLVIIGYSLNDIGVLSRQRTLLVTYRGYDSFLTTGNAFIDRLLPLSKTYLLLKNRLFLKKTNADTNPQYSKDGLKLIQRGYQRFFFEAYAEPENWNALVKAFAKIRDLTRPRIPVLMVIHPELQEMERYLFRDLHATVGRLATDHGFLFLDPLDEILARRPRDLRISDANTHPNALANKVFIQAISRFLLKSSMIK